MKHCEKKLAAIENLYLSGRSLSDIQLRSATNAVSSTNLRTSLIGCVAILCARNITPNQKREARERFESICNGVCCDDDTCKVEVLFDLLQLPIEELAGSQTMRGLAYRTVKEGRTSLRANAVLVLERLAKNGDSLALSLIREALDDYDKVVKKNAEVALQNIGIPTR